MSPLLVSPGRMTSPGALGCLTVLALLALRAIDENGSLAAQASVG